MIHSFQINYVLDQQEVKMSANEFLKVKESLGLMMNYTITHYAIEISAALANRNRAEKDTSEWWYYNMLGQAEFEEFTNIIETIYPNNPAKMNDLVQRLDDETAEHDYREELTNGAR